jgi:hypothetical protein
VCEETLATLRLNLSDLTPELTPKWDKLVSLLRSLAGCNARSKFPNDEVDAYLKELLELEEELRKDGITAYESTGSTEDRLIEMAEKMQLTAANPESAPSAKTLISQLLRRNLLWVALIKEKLVIRIQSTILGSNRRIGKGESILRSRMYTTNCSPFETNLRSYHLHKHGLCAKQISGTSNVSWTALTNLELTATFSMHWAGPLKFMSRE